MTACNDALLAHDRPHARVFHRARSARLTTRASRRPRAALRGSESSYDGPYAPTGGGSGGAVSLHTQPVLDGDGAVVGGFGVIAGVARSPARRRPPAVER